ncbi:hypothetical protein QF010_006617 [Pseudomonas silensiensis]
MDCDQLMGEIIKRLNRVIGDDSLEKSSKSSKEPTQTETGDGHFGNLPHPEFELPGRVNGPGTLPSPPRKNEP